MSLFIIDVESDGPVPGLYSMVSFAAIKVDPELKTTFKAFTKPISEKWDKEALSISNISRETHETYPEPEIGIRNFVKWVKLVNNGKRPIFMSDSLGYDWSFMNYYCHRYYGENPFGYGGRDMNDFCAGIDKNFYGTDDWEKLIITPHTHDPIDDAKGVAEAFLTICKQYNIKFPS